MEREVEGRAADGERTGPSQPVEQKQSKEPKQKKEWSAWSEYLGEERDEEYVEWKKEMVGEGRVEEGQTEQNVGK